MIGYNFFRVVLYDAVLARYAIALSVRLSVRHKSVLYRNGRTGRIEFIFVTEAELGVSYNSLEGNSSRPI